MTHVNIVREVVPRSGFPGRAPLRLALHAPLQLGRIWSDAYLELGEVGLEEEDLVFSAELR